MSTYRLHVRDDFLRNDVEIALIRTAADGQRAIASGLSFVPIDPGSSADILRLVDLGESQRTLLQSIVDGAWEAGFRPSGYGDVKESLKAKDAHLQDMRAIAFHKIGVNK